MRGGLRAAARTVHKAFVVLLVGLTLVASRRRTDPRVDFVAWLSLAALSGLASNFAGPHVQVGTALVLLVLAGEVRSAMGWAMFGALWVLTSYWPLPEGVLLAGGLLQTPTMVATLGWLMVRPAPATPTEPAPAPAVVPA